MALYAFECAACGPFDVSRPMAEAGAPAACPACGAAGRRVFTSPGLARMPRGLRRARDREEKSAHEPEVVSAPSGRPLHLGHGHGHRH